jgi:peptide-methionine (S)-S-oxide reductase
MKTEIATFGAGCFWGVEAKFMRTPGVKETNVGYMGGKTQKPTYEDVCSGSTGHAEVVHLIFDPTKISFDQLLDVFFKLHDPTTPDRQGPDVGSQYRSVVFYHNADQKRRVSNKIDELNQLGTFGNHIVTKVTPAGEFWTAEEYHQKYLQKRGQSDCRI